jgi:glutamate--cysteine ligase
VPSPSRCLTAGDALNFVRARAIHPPVDHPRIGLELEWLTFHRHDRLRRVTPEDLAPALRAIGELPCHGRITVEPGGQVELSSLPQPSVADAIDATRTDMLVLRGALADAGISLEGVGLDRVRPPQRVVEAGRYRAMETYFDALGLHGRAMMCNTASIQVNVDVDGDPVEAWRAATLAAPLLAQFFNSPSPNRMDVWSHMDASRVGPVCGTDLPSAWAAYALDARVMFIRCDGDDCVPVLNGMTFADWLAHGHPLGWPTASDLAEHLTTLFPPVRPRGWFEIRTIDALGDDCWPRAAELTAALLLEGADRRRLLESGEVPAWT